MDAASIFLAVAVAVTPERARVAAATFLRPCVVAGASTTTVTDASSSARSTAFIRGMGTAATSQADRRAVASTEPRVAPERSRSCRAGWENSGGSDREVETDTDCLSWMSR